MCLPMNLEDDMIRILALAVLLLTIDRYLTLSAAEPANPETNHKGRTRF